MILYKIPVIDDQKNVSLLGLKEYLVSMIIVSEEKQKLNY